MRIVYETVTFYTEAQTSNSIEEKTFTVECPVCIPEYNDASEWERLQQEKRKQVE